MQFPTTFDFIKEDSNKDQVIKIIEEAAELLQAEKEESRERALEEAIDVFQALANYCEAKFTPDELQRGYDQVFMKNWRRGYYDVHIDGTYYEKAAQHAQELGNECQ